MAQITSTQTGQWDVGGTWVGGNSPGDNDDAIIADGHIVTIDSTITVGNEGAAGTDAWIVQSGGTLAFAANAAVILNSEGDGHVESGGTLSSTPDVNTRQGIHFTKGAADGDYAWRVEDGSTCSLQGHADYGGDRTTFRVKATTTMTAASSTTVETDDSILDDKWSSGDQVALSGTDYNDGEILTIDSVSTDTITFTGACTRNHAIGSIIILLTRNFFIKGDATPGFTDVYLDDTNGQTDIDYVEFENMGKWGGAYGIGFGVTTAAPNPTIDNCSFHTGNGMFMYFYRAASDLVLTNNVAFNADGQENVRTNANDRLTFTNWASIKTIANYNFYLANKSTGTVLNTCWIYDGPRSGIYLDTDYYTELNNCEIVNARSYAIEDKGSTGTVMTGGMLQIYENNNQAYISQYSSSSLLDNVLLYKNGYSRGTSDGYEGPGINHNIKFQNFHATPGDHRYYKSLTISKYCKLQTEDTTVHTANNSALKMTLNNTDNVDFEVPIDIPCANGDIITMWGYYRKSGAASQFTTQPTVTLVADESAADINETASISDVIDGWEYFSFGGTKTGDGYIRITLKARLGSGGSGNVFFDDMKIMIGSAVYDVAQTWSKGYPGFSMSAVTTTAEGLWKVDISGAEYSVTGMAADYLKDIPDAVWDELQSGHTTAGSFGKISKDTWLDTKQLY